MSLILDALKKADKKRSESPPQDNTAARDAELMQSGDQPLDAAQLKNLAIKNWGMVCVCLILTSLVLFLAYLLIGENYEANNNEGNLNAQEKNESNFITLQREAYKATQQDQSALEGKTANQSQIDSLYAQPGSEEHPKPILENEQTSSSDIDSLYANDNAINQETRNATARFNQTLKEQNFETASLTTQSAPNENSIPEDLREAYEKINDPHADVLDLRSMPPTFQDSIPTLMYSKHKYIERGTSTITINKQRLFEGSILDSNIKVVSIKKRSVILQVGGTQFKVLAMNSWINF